MSEDADDLELHRKLKSSDDGLRLSLTDAEKIFQACGDGDYECPPAFLAAMKKYDEEQN